MTHAQDQEDHLKTAYQTAVQLMLYEGNVLWTRLNAMVVLNALLIASSTLLIQGRILPIAASLPPILGALLSVALFVIMYRGEDFRHYWEVTAMSIEKYLSLPAVQPITRNCSLRDEGEQTFSLKDREITVKLHFRKFRARVALFAVTGLLIMGDLALAAVILFFLPSST
jgi:hypothetical protein